MLIASLARYHDCLRRMPECPLPLEGYSEQKVDFLACLTEEGEISNILPYVTKETRGKKEVEVSRTEVYPERVSVSAISSYYVEHRAAYLFGLEWDEKQERLIVTEKAKKSHDAFLEKNRGFFQDLDSPCANAFSRFMENWSPERETENGLLSAIGKRLGGASFAFCPEDDLTDLLNRDQAVKAKWEEVLAGGSGEEEVIGPCAICGETLPLARLHDKVKIRGGDKDGSKLVCFNSASEESYGLKQSYNSSVSRLVMKKYTRALRYLLNSPQHSVTLDDLTICFWAETDREEAVYAESVSQALSGRQTEADEAKQKQLASIFAALERGVEVDYGQFGLDGKTEFCIAGFVPNVARIAVKFFYRNEFGSIMKRLTQHMVDMRVSDTQRQSSVYQIAKETKSPNSTNEKVDPGLASALLQAILSGGLYPRSMLDKFVQRIKTDRDEEKKRFIKFNPVRVGAIKAYLNRKARLSGEKEYITMGLDREDERPSYLCGRLFAVLERAQENALGQVNATIRDKFLPTACSTPSVVFPHLILLAHKHIGKDTKYGGYSEYLLGEIVSKLNGGFPKTLNNEQQGEFLIGYYQQRQAFYEKKEEKEEEQK